MDGCTKVVMPQPNGHGHVFYEFVRKIIPFFHFTLFYIIHYSSHKIYIKKKKKHLASPTTTTSNHETVLIN